MGLRMPPKIIPRAPELRFRVEPGDVPAEKVARRLHLSEAKFRECLPRLLARGFPMPDPDTGMFDLEAVDRWRHGRHLSLFPELTPSLSAPENTPPRKSMGDRFAEAEKRNRGG